MEIIIETTALIVDDGGRIALPQPLAAQLRQARFVIEAVSDGDGTPMLLGMPASTAADAVPATIDDDGRLTLPPRLLARIDATAGQILRLVGRGRYFVIMRGPRPGFPDDFEDAGR
ncbi:MAG: hypothetical protein H3C38_13210 [Rhodospirillales bacterium]|nr:hypothetical protein [Rhodospirillales bacterium]